MKETLKCCQSCSMPLAAPEQYGTNADQTRSEEYCVYCYKDGAFTDPGATVGGMIELCVPFLTENGRMSEQEARTQLTAIIPALKRWK